MSEVCHPKSDVQSPKSKVLSPRSEVRNPKLEVRSPKSDVLFRSVSARKATSLCVAYLSRLSAFDKKKTAFPKLSPKWQTSISRQSPLQNCPTHAFFYESNAILSQAFCVSDQCIHSLVRRGAKKPAILEERDIILPVQDFQRAHRPLSRWRTMGLAGT